MGTTESSTSRAKIEGGGGELREEKKRKEEGPCSVRAGDERILGETARATADSLEDSAPR